MSARFRFALQPVLDLRRRVEEDRMTRVAVIERQRRELEDRLRSIQSEIAGAKQDLRSHLSGAAGPVQLGPLRLGANASIHLAVRAQRTAIELAGVHARLQGAREELARATSGRKAVETLKARRFEQWRIERARAEQAGADELAVMRHAREDGPWA